MCCVVSLLSYLCEFILFLLLTADAFDPLHLQVHKSAPEHQLLLSRTASLSRAAKTHQHIK